MILKTKTISSGEPSAKVPSGKVPEKVPSGGRTKTQRKQKKTRSYKNKH